MEPGFFDVDDADRGRALVVDLALSVESAVAWWMDFTTDELTWMPGLDEILGVAGADDDVVHNRLSELVAPMTVAAKAAPVWRDFALEQSFETADGGARCIQFRGRTFAHSDTRGVLGIATNVTDKQNHQLALTDLADRYRLLVELSPEIIVVHEAGTIVYINPAGLRNARATSPSDMVGHPIMDFVHPDSIPETLRRIQNLTAPGAYTEPSEAVLFRVDGTTLLVEAVSVRTTWNGRPAFQVIMRDITEEKAAAAALRYQAALVTHVSDAIIATTVDGIVTSWNPAAENVYGYSAAEAVGRPVPEVVGAPLDPIAIITAGGVAQGSHRRSDGSRLAVRVSAAHMDDGYVLVCADETARRKAEEHYTTVVASIEEGVVVIGSTGLVDSINPAAQRILGVGETETVGMPSALANLYDETGARIPPEDYPSARTRRTGQPENGRIIRCVREDGSDVWLSMSCRALSSAAAPGFVVSFTDITERRRIDAKLAQDATHDALTGLVNRTVAINRLSAQERARHPGLTAVLFIDLDKFKVINDSLGHGVGDRVLQIMGARLRRTIAGGDLVGRLGGDEFAVIAHGISGPEDAVTVAERLRHTLSRPVTVDGRHLHIDASIGIVIAGPEDVRDGEDILRDADLAMYQAKTKGRSTYAIFDVELRERTQRRLQLEQDLRGAARKGQLWLAYQPIVDLKSGATVAVEGLLRWSHPRYGAISPGEFIPLAEESDLINVVGTYMLRTATTEIIRLREREAGLRLAVNLSARQLDDPQLVPDVRRVLETAGLSPSTLCMEITESAVMRDPVAAGRTLAALRELGACLAIDDFGTGYSSLAQLLRLPLDTLKIDQSFTAGLGRSKEAEAIVTSIVAMAHAVDLNVIAEGVEGIVQLEILQGLGCDQAQGYYLGRPVSAGDLFGPV